MITYDTQFDASAKPSIDPLAPFETKLSQAIDIIKHTDTKGCIVGSTMFGANMELWDSKPDIDVFVFSNAEAITLIDQLRYKYGFDFGCYDGNAKQQKWHYKQLLKDTKKKFPVETVKLIKDDIVINITCKYKGSQPVSTTPGILSTFDMTIAMIGYDIQSHCIIDMRTKDTNVAHPNPFRSFEPITWNVAKWIRQFDRIVKYYNRGFDTRPMARFYIDLIDDCLAEGSLFTSEAALAVYEEYAKEFRKMRIKIEDWLEGVINDQH